MHEYSLVQALLDKVHEEARRHDAAAVHHVRVRIGRLAGVETDLLRTAYEMCREKTLCAGADLEIVPVEPLWACPGCDRRIEPGRPLRCESCGRPAHLAQGDEIVLDRLEMEAA
jgi:hydrogenase nickel incorporation protein HypA/HybF